MTNARRTYNIAGPETLRVNGMSFLDLPYNKKIYVKNGDYHITKMKHADDIGVYRFTINYKEAWREDLELTYDPNNFKWVSVNNDLLG